MKSPNLSTADVNNWSTVNGVSAASPESSILNFTSPSSCEVHSLKSDAAGTDREFGRWALTEICERSIDKNE